MNVNYVTGNLFDTEAKVMVNPVNCAGRMNEGVTNQFKERHQVMFRECREMCEGGFVSPGRAHLIEVRRKTQDHPSLNVALLPTQHNLQGRTEAQHLENGLRELTGRCRNYGYRHVAMPWPGDGLEDSEARNMIEKASSESPDVRVDVYAK